MLKIKSTSCHFDRSLMINSVHVTHSHIKYIYYSCSLMFSVTMILIYSKFNALVSNAQYNFFLKKHTNK